MSHSISSSIDPVSPVTRSFQLSYSSAEATKHVWMGPRAPCGGGRDWGRRKSGVEEKQQAFTHAKRQTRASDGMEAENLAVEPG